MLNRVKVLQIIREITVGKRRDDEDEIWKMYSPSSAPQQHDLMDHVNVLNLTSSPNPTSSENKMADDKEGCKNGSEGDKVNKAERSVSRRGSKDSGAGSEPPRAKSLLKASLNDQNRLDRLFLDAVKNVRALLDSDRATLWLIDSHNKTLWSKVAEGIPHIRVPMDKGIVGWTCVNNKSLNIRDAYKDDRFNPSVDKKTGYKTSTILCVPINIQVVDESSSNSTVMATKMVGIIQVINKNGPKGAHFTDYDVNMLERFCSRIGPAVHRCQTVELQGTELRRTLRDLRKEMSKMR